MYIYDEQYEPMQGNWDDEEDDDEMTARFRLAVEMAIAERKAAGLPIVRYDRVRKAPYLEYPDGRIEYET